MPKNTKKVAPDIIIPPSQNKKHHTAKWIAGCCVFFVLFFSIIGNIAALGFAVRTFWEPGETLKENVYQGKGDAANRIALINLSGVISSPSDPGSVLSQQGNTQDVLDQLNRVKSDDSIKAVLLEVDSPGGSVTASEDLFQKISDVETAGKKVVTYIHTEAASGAYYATCGTDYIIANPTSLNGSIGVIVQSYNYGDLLNKYGVHVETFKSGPFKDMLDGARASTPEEKQIVQGIIDSSYNIFVDHIVSGRKLDKPAVLKVADGRVLTATQAKDDKLIDEVGYEKDAVTKAASLANIANYDVITYQRKGGLLQKLGFAPLGAATSFVTNLLQGHTQSTQLYFL